MNSLLENKRNQIVCKEEIENIKKEYNKLLEEHQKKLYELEKEESLLANNIDIDKFNRGKEIIEIEFPICFNKYRLIYGSLKEAAVEDLVSGCKILKEKYIGQKNYEGYDQRSDHPYGYGPTHGTVYQSIGLKENYRKDLTDDEIECALYYLANLTFEIEELNKLLHK